MKKDKSGESDFKYISLTEQCETTHISASARSVTVNLYHT